MQTEVQSLAVKTEGDSVIVNVPWEHANSFQTYLRGQGIETVLCADVRTREAHLEFPSGTIPATVQSALDRLGA